jgi:hypothetical protein
LQSQPILSPTALLPGRGQNLGQSDKNTSQRSRALVLLKAIAKKMHMKSFENLDPEKDPTTEEEMKEYYRQISVCLASGVPHTVDKNFNSKKKAVLGWTSILQMMLIINTLMKEKFPNHPSFPKKKGDNDKWYNQLVNMDMLVQFGHNAVQPVFYDLMPGNNDRDPLKIATWQGWETEEGGAPQEVNG